MSEVITIAQVYCGCGIVSTVDRLNNITRVCLCATKNVRLPWLTIDIMLRVPYRTDSDSDTDGKIIKHQQRHCPHLTYNTIHLDSFQNNPRNQVSVTRSQFAYPERITRPGRLLSEWVAVTLSGSASSQ